MPNNFVIIMAQLFTNVQHAVKHTHRHPLSAQTEEYMRCMWQNLSYFQCFIQPQRCRERRWEWNITMLTDPAFSTAELSITSRRRTGTRQKKQNRGLSGKFLPGIRECLNTTGMHNWNLLNCRDSYRNREREQHRLSPKVMRL